MEHRTLAWVLVITGTCVHFLSQCLERIPREKCSKSKRPFFQLLKLRTCRFRNYRSRPSPYSFLNSFFTFLKFPCANRNYRCKLFSTKSKKKELSKWTKKKQNEKKKKKITQKLNYAWRGSNHQPINQKSLNFQVRHEGLHDHVGRIANFPLHIFSSNSSLLPEPIRCLE